MAFFTIGDKVLNIAVNIFLAILGWYWVLTDGDILSYVVALPFTLFTLIELKNYLKKSD
tara:strand:- start:310 stop:486 length:177 start_codon:yes stop_codon:yes gene_type:complete